MAICDCVRSTDGMWKVGSALVMRMCFLSRFDECAVSSLPRPLPSQLLPLLLLLLMLQLPPLLRSPSLTSSPCPTTLWRERPTRRSRLACRRPSSGQKKDTMNWEWNSLFAHLCAHCVFYLNVPVSTYFSWGVIDEIRITSKEGEKEVRSTHCLSCLRSFFGSLCAELLTFLHFCFLFLR
jgi:hypothetical protein